MNGTTPGSGSGDEPKRDPFSSPSGDRPDQDPQSPGLPSWRESVPSESNMPPAPMEGGGMSFAPRPIVLAVRLMYVGAGLTALSLLFALFSRDSIRDAVIDSDPDLTQSEIDTAVNISYGVATVFPLIAIGLWLWMAWANKRGRSWARVVATILGGLNILFALMNITLGGFGLNTLLNLISPVLAGVILYLLYRPESGEYYRQMSAPKF
ncbi:hypothetical protein [Phytoactinopolyspora halotolerans]|uniref:Uncharacterized protein n=1 Tax=Phytoactinopolyspora halotolerans TaxID=1981512 RepID=A0A6L9S688_9ACTN|nr:hypothetical protein [Phytoactinopolyspora halotolerans]NEE00271.1 hypothetical protein [Phytoactinopolyspora halotolerans]